MGAELAALPSRHLVVLTPASRHTLPAAQNEF